MAEIIEKAEEAYAGREAAQAQIARLKTAAEDEQAAFVEEWQQLGDTVDNDRKHKRGFPATAGREGVFVGQDGEPQDEVAYYKKQIARALWQIAWEKAKQEVSLNKVNVYEKAFERIKKATGITEVADLVDSFMAAEEQNFSLYRFNDELSREIEKMELDIQKIRDEKAVLMGGEVNNMESNRLRALRELETKLERAGAKTQFFYDKHAATVDVVNELKPGVFQIFKQLKCDGRDGGADLAAEGVTESNMDTFLVMIEERAIELMQAYAKRKALEEGTTFTLDQLITRPYDETHQVGGGGPVYEIVPPTIDDETGVDLDLDDDAGGNDRPMTRNELKDKAMRVVARRAPHEKAEKD